MEMFFSAFTSTLTPQTIFSMLGGLLGAMIASDRKRYGWQLSLLFFIASVAVTAAMGEYLQYERKIDSLWWLLVLNIPLGMIVGATLDVIRITSPPLIERLVKGIGGSGVSIIIESVLGRLAKWFGVDLSDFDSNNNENSENTSKLDKRE